MANDYRIKEHAKALLQKRPAEEPFSEGPTHGFKGGGAQPDEWGNAVAGAAASGLLGAAGIGGQGLKRAATVAENTWDDSRGLAALYEAVAKHAPELGKFGGKVERFAVAPGEAHIAAKSATNLAKDAEPTLMTRAREVLQSLTKSNYTTPQASEANAARSVARKVVPELEDNTLVTSTPASSDAATNAGHLPVRAQQWLANHAAGKPAMELVAPEHVHAHDAILKHFTALTGNK